MPKEVKDSIMDIKGVNKVELDLVWEPPWDKSMMSEAAKLELNYISLTFLGRYLFTDWAIPFELASLVLLIALIGAVLMVKTSREGEND